MRMMLIGAAGALALLAGCGGGNEEGGVTAEESKQLNEAAEMLDTAPETIVPPDETGLENGAADANATDDSSLNAQ